MAKLGVIHYNFPNFTFDEFLKFAADTGYRYIELQVSVIWRDENETPEASAERMRVKIESHGLSVSALAAQNDFLQPDEHSVRAEVERMRRICGLARILHPEAVVRSEGGVPKEEIPKEKWLDGLYECFAPCVPFAEELGVGIAIDNHGIVTNDGDLLFALIQKLGSRFIGTNLDTMNYRWLGHDLATCDRFYEILAPHTLHTHMKDGFDSREHYRGAALGEGEIHLGHALEQLRKVGYDGVYCAEYEGPEAAGGVGYGKCYQWLKANV